MKRKRTKPFPENEKALVANSYRESLILEKANQTAGQTITTRETTEQGLKQTFIEIFNVMEIWKQLINGALFSVFATTPS